MKKISLMLAAVATFALVSCGGSNDSEASNAEGANAENTENAAGDEQGAAGDVSLSDLQDLAGGAGVDLSDVEGVDASDVEGVDGVKVPNVKVPSNVDEARSQANNLVDEYGDDDAKKSMKAVNSSMDAMQKSAKAAESGNISDGVEALKATGTALKDLHDAGAFDE